MKKHTKCGSIRAWVKRLKKRVSELNDIVANQQVIIDQQESRIEELEDMLQNYAPVPKTGQKSCYDWRGGGLIDCEGTGRDGELQKGRQWPYPRFTDNYDGTVTDHLTGLIWLKNANCYGIIDNDDALRFSNKLENGECGLSDGSRPGDWRLPNVRELYSLIDFGNEEPALPSGHPFTSVQLSYYYTSTSLVTWSHDTWSVHMMRGHVLWSCDDDCYVWPVRGGN